MMKDKLTKAKMTKFDILCKKLGFLGLIIMPCSILSFIPINHILQNDKNVMLAEINGNKNEDEINIILQKKVIHIGFRNLRDNFKNQK